MFGLPQQTIDDALYDLKTAIALEPTHLSWYQLTLEPNTLFYHSPPTLPNDDYLFDMQEQGHYYLKSQDFQQYEISAFAQDNFACRHNLNYWEFGDYLAIGAGAHSKLTQENGKIVRTVKIKHPKDYLNAGITFNAEQKIVKRAELPLEFMMNALRLQQKIPLSLFENRTGLSMKHIEKSLEIATKKELLECKNDFIHVTKQGKMFLNDLLQIFLPKSARNFSS